MNTLVNMLGEQTGLMIALALALVLLFVRAAVRDVQTRRDLRTSILYFAGYVGTHLVWQLLLLQKLGPWPKYAQVLSYLLFAFGAVHAGTGLALWAARSRRGLSTPKILRDVIHFVLYFIALATVLRATLKLDLGSLVATSAVLSVVIGLALQETLGNLFSGLSLQLERPFSVGDWIKVGDHVGQVTQVSWRAIRIQTVRSEQVSIPNAVIAKEYLLNFSRHEGGIGKDVFIEVDYNSPPHAVREACLQVLADHPKILKHPAPLFRVSKWEASGVQYQVRFFVADMRILDDMVGEVLSLLWYRMRREGFEIPFPTRTVYLHQAKASSELHEQKDLFRLLGSVDFLRPLGDDGVNELAKRARLQLFGRGEVIIRQGEPGETFYVTVSGRLSVRTEETGAEIARLERGAFFGEMSLLTGEPRSATVVALEDSQVLCLERAPFKQLFEGNEALAQALSEALARRATELKGAKAAGAVGASAVHIESSRIFSKIREILRLR